VWIVCVCACVSAAQLICVMCNVLTLELSCHVHVSLWSATLHGGGL